MKKLISFLLCSTFLLSLSLSSQIIYTDIIPDSVLLRPPIPVQNGSAANSYDFYINNDSTIDLTFHLSASKYYLYELNIYQIITTESISSNGTSFFLIEGDNCMKVLDQYDTIDMNQYWTLIQITQ